MNPMARMPSDVPKFRASADMQTTDLKQKAKSECNEPVSRGASRTRTEIASTGSPAASARGWRAENVQDDLARSWRCLSIL